MGVCWLVCLWVCGARVVPRGWVRDSPGGGCWLAVVGARVWARGGWGFGELSGWCSGRGLGRLVAWWCDGFGVGGGP